MGKLSLLSKPVVAFETIIGSEGEVVTALTPEGYVKVQGELWQASSDSYLEAGAEVVVTGIANLKLKVIPKKPPYSD